MLMRDYVIILIIFSAIVGIGALVVADIASEDQGYNIENMTDSTFDSAYNKAQYTNQLVEEMGNASTSKEGLGLVGGASELLFGSTITIIQLVAGSFNVVSNVFVSMTTSFGIPLGIANLLFGAVLSIIITIIVFVIVSSLTKTKV